MLSRRGFAAIISASSDGALDPPCRASLYPCAGTRRAHLSNRSPTKSSRGGMADAYGSGPYGETRGGSTPLVSTYPFRDYWLNRKSELRKQGATRGAMLRRRARGSQPPASLRKSPVADRPC